MLGACVATRCISFTDFGILVDEVTPLQLNGAAQNQHTPRGAGGFLARGPPATAAP